MKKKILHILCEGQTEEGFVNGVLRSYLLARGFDAVKCIIVTTNKQKNNQGGISSFSHVKDDMNAMLHSNLDNMSEKHVFTSMFDYYGLSSDFPGYDEAKQKIDPYECVSVLEQSFSANVKDSRFIPYIQLHEFEALLFCGIDYLINMYPNSKKTCNRLTKALQLIGNPELINNNPATSPSKRIIHAIEGDKKKTYRYNKVLAGKYVTGRIGIDDLRSQCQHFNEWIESLLNA